MVCMFTLFTPFRLFNSVQIPTLFLSYLTFLNVSIYVALLKTYFQPHFVLQHSPHFLQEMRFLVLIGICDYYRRVAFLSSFCGFAQVT